MEHEYSERTLAVMGVVTDMFAVLYRHLLGILFS